VSLVLDPRYKSGFFRLHSDIFDDEWLDDCKNNMLDYFSRDYPLQNPPQQGLSSPAPFATQQYSSTGPSKMAMRFEKVLGRIPTSVAFTAGPEQPEDELKRYMEEDSIHMDADPLLWWRINQHRYPRVSAFARDILAIPGSSVAVERTLSSGRDMLGVRRMALAEDVMRTLMRLKSGLGLERKVYAHMDAATK
jgi:hypothetical protein